jgi:hypothetical protein
MNHLTNEQKRIQETAAYGLPQQRQTLDVSGMTHEQIEALRGVLFQHDAANAAMTREFDLNKPPTPPYRYQEYPRMLYRDTETAIVRNQMELEQSLASGWSKTPAASMEVNLGGELSPAMRAEAQAIDARLRAPSREDLLQQEIELLRAENEALKTAAETSHDDPAEEEKRRKRSADAANAARARWEKRKQAPAASAPAVEGATSYSHASPASVEAVTMAFIRRHPSSKGHYSNQVLESFREHGKARKLTLLCLGSTPHARSRDGRPSMPPPRKIASPNCAPFQQKHAEFKRTEASR